MRKGFPKTMLRTLLALAMPGAVCLCACSGASEGARDHKEAVSDERIRVERYDDAVSDVIQSGEGAPELSGEASRADKAETGALEREGSASGVAANEGSLKTQLGIVEDFRPSLSHGPKTAAHQRYIVLHDTEGGGSPASVVDWWDSNGNLVAAHFVVGKDGTIVQCVPLDEIAHHAGYGDAGHNDLYGIQEDGRDDMEGSSPIGAWAPDYALNAWSVGIEMVHVGGEGDYPDAQLRAVDGLIAYIDAYYGFESDIIDHKAWRSGNSDTSEEFADYLQNYQSHRVHE